MLLDENLRRREQRHLMTVADHDHRCNQRNDRLSAAHVALQQAVHRPIALQIVNDFLHDAFLRPRQLERQNFSHFSAHRVVNEDFAIFFLHLFARPAHPQRELKGEELLQNDPAVCR